MRTRLALAALLFLSVSALAPEDVGLKHAIGLVERALEAGDTAKARDLIQRALERDRKSREVWALRTRWAKSVGDADELLYSSHQELRLAEAQRAKKPEIAALRERVLALDPIAPDLFAMKVGFQKKLLKIAEDYEKRDRPHAAIRTYKQILSLDPEHAESLAAIERIAATPDPSLAGDAKPKDLFEDVSREWIDQYDAEHANWKARGKLSRTNYNTHSDAGYEVIVRSAEAMEQMNAFYRLFFRFGTEEHGGSVPRIDLRIFRDRDEYLELGTGPPVEWSAGQFTGSAVETYVNENGFEGMVGTLFHEAAHQFVGLATSATGWLNEGLASFFEGTRILANGTVIMNMPANHRLFPLAERMDRGWMKTFDDGLDEANANATPQTAPTFRIVLEDRYSWGPPWYAPTWGLVYFLYNYQDLTDGRFLYRSAFQEFIDSSGGRSGDGAVRNFEEVVLAHPLRPYKLDGDVERATLTGLPKTAEELDEVWRNWILALRDEQQGKLVVERDYGLWGKYAALNKDYEVAKEHYEKGLVSEPNDVEMLLGFAELLEERFKNEDRAAKLVTRALRVLESASEPDEKAIRAAEKQLGKLDPKLKTLTEVQEEMAASARSLVKRYEASGSTLMVMDLAWRLGTELELPDLFDSYRAAVTASGKSLRIWELAYNEDNLDGWNASTSATAFQPAGSILRASKGKYDPANFDFEFLTLDKVTSGDFSMEAEVLATRGEVNFCGLVFGQKAPQSFHAVALFPGSEKTAEGLAGTGFVELFSFYGGTPKTWRRSPVETRDTSERSSTARWHTLRLDVSGRNADFWFDGQFLASHEFPDREVLQGRFGLIMGSGKAEFRNIRYLAVSPGDPVAAIERGLRLDQLRDESGGSLGGSYLGMTPPFPKVGRWFQGARADWEERGNVPQLFVLFSIKQNDLIRIDEWLMELAERTKQFGLEVICLASANDLASLASYLKTHPMPGAIGVDSRAGVGIGDTFTEYSVERFNLPRLILLDVNQTVAWEGDPGFTTTAPWTPGRSSTLSDSLQELIENRQLAALGEWRKRWDEVARVALETGDLEAAIETLKSAFEFDPRFSKSIARAVQQYELVEASLAAIESTAASLQREDADAALEVLLEWGPLFDHPIDSKQRKLLKDVLGSQSAKDWQKAVKALTTFAGKKRQDEAAVDALLAKLGELTGRFVRDVESSLHEAREQGGLEAFGRAVEVGLLRPRQWLASEYFYFGEDV